MLASSAPAPAPATTVVNAVPSQKPPVVPLAPESAQTVPAAPALSRAVPLPALPQAVDRAPVDQAVAPETTPKRASAGPDRSVRCSDILQKASLEPLSASEAAFLKSECR
ncbi:MAG: hypothetical protein EOP40_12895 [Rubrivivax sp.]|nr:MAG: hypothetical protein EOP40_12895 [Rubrivivax sp.]